jgi:uncharacterized membrane protein
MFDRIRRNIIAGVLTTIPIVVTLWIVTLLGNFLIGLGRPAVLTFASWIRAWSPETADFLVTGFFQSALALAVMLVGFYLLGGLASFVAGRRLIALFDAAMERIPGIAVLYGAVRRMIESLSQPFPGGQRVVLVKFPSQVTRAVGFITRTFTAPDDGRKMAAVFVPTTPNPTSGFVIVAPVDDLIFLDWTTDQAAGFIVSAGTTGPQMPRFEQPKSAVEPAKWDGTTEVK